MYFLKLTRVPDGATVYVSPYAIACMARHEPTATMPVHTAMLLLGGRTVNVIEHPDVIIDRERTFAFEGMTGYQTHSVIGPPTPSPAAEPGHAVSPR